jgi:hypothetical protein
VSSRSGWWRGESGKAGFGGIVNYKLTSVLRYQTNGHTTSSFWQFSYERARNMDMDTLLHPIELTESEMDHVSGGAGNGYGEGQGLGAENNGHSQGHAWGNGHGQGAENGNGRFAVI